MNEENIIEMTAEENGRIDKLISIENMSRSAVQNLIESGNITVNGKAVAKNFKLSVGDSIKIVLPEPVDADILPENIPLDIRYEDSDLLVVNKPKEWSCTPHRVT